MDMEVNEPRAVDLRESPRDKLPRPRAERALHPGRRSGKITPDPVKQRAATSGKQSDQRKNGRDGSPPAA
jgi:hypothetical protein